MRKLFMIAIVLMLAAASVATASAKNTDQHLALAQERSEVTPEAFAQLRQRLMKEIDETDKYSEITPRQRVDVIASLDRMAALLDSAGSLEAMPMDRRVEMLNEQEKINTMLTDVAADSRLICTREHTVGTRMRKTQCFTVAERRQRRETDQDASMRELFHNRHVPVENDFRYQ